MLLRRAWTQEGQHGRGGAALGCAAPWLHARDTGAQGQGASAL
jgi:hypothetical protein